jgi:hypothetical protein
MPLAAPDPKIAASRAWIQPNTLLSAGIPRGSRVPLIRPEWGGAASIPSGCPLRPREGAWRRDHRARRRSAAPRRRYGSTGPCSPGALDS